jgi:hypothetical protein
MQPQFYFTEKPVYLKYENCVLGLSAYVTEKMIFLKFEDRHGQRS